jgi:hypothetical protein
MARAWQFASYDAWREPTPAVYGMNLLELLMSADLPDEEPVPGPSNPPYRPVHHQEGPKPVSPKADPTSPGEAPGPHPVPDVWQPQH